MNRIVTAIFAILGILAISMPGDTCFLWAGLGVDHHHHGSAESVEQDTACFHVFERPRMGPRRDADGRDGGGATCACAMG